MAQVIEWANASPDDIVWRYPNDRIGWGSELIVREGQAAVFFRDGKAYDVFGPGRHTITTQNLPLITKVIKAIRGWDKSPFTATIIFVSLKIFQGKFGGRSQTTELAPLKFHGEYWFRIADPKVFVIEVVGNNNAFTTADVNQFIRSYITEKCIKELAQYTLRQVFIEAETTSMKVKTKLKDAFARLGLELVDLKFGGMDTDEKYRERLFWMQTGGVSAQQLAWQETMQGVASGLGKSPGAAFGTGMMMMPTMMQQGAAFMQQPPPAAPAPAPQQTIRCPQCGAVIPANSRFCPQCGARLR